MKWGGVDMTAVHIARRNLNQRRTLIIALAAGLASFHLTACATISPAIVDAQPLASPLANCANEVVAAWRDARATAATGCDWAAVATLDDARKVQSAALITQFGNKPRIGYKITFTSDGSTVGEYRQGMLAPSGQSISKTAAWQTFPEADMLFRVKNSGINQVQSLEEALKHIDAILPFVEVSNPIVRAGGGRTSVNWTATNASVGSGVMGKPFPIDLSQPETMRRFLAMKVTLTDPTGAVVRDAGVAADFLPALLTLRDEIRVRGERLKAGDLLSLGTFGRPVTGDVLAGPYTVTYHGLAEASLSATAVITP
jgi:2-keto-4-pentenoate hydratase